jgi:predicted nucleic acid-binding protein
VPNYFYDSSALVKRYHTEPGSEVINPLFDEDARHFISELTVVEIHSAISKKRLTNASATDEALRQVRAQFSNDLKSLKIAVVRIGSAHYQEAERLVRQYGTDTDAGIIRSLDALQLAVALDFQSRTEIDVFLSSDQRQCNVALAEGLTVRNPELHESKE